MDVYALLFVYALPVLQAYYEDSEYVIRLRTLTPPGITKVYLNARAIHGAASAAGYISGITNIHDPAYRQRLDRGAKASQYYLKAKWNVSSVDNLDFCYKHPFNNRSAPASYWVHQPVHRSYVLTGHSWEAFTGLYPRAR